MGTEARGPRVELSDIRKSETYKIGTVKHVYKDHPYPIQIWSQLTGYYTVLLTIDSLVTHGRERHMSSSNMINNRA